MTTHTYRWRVPNRGSPTTPMKYAHRIVPHTQDAADIVKSLEGTRIMKEAGA